MFFFVGGIQPKTKTLDETPRLCPACGLAQARLKRIDHYLSLFFIPLISVKKGEPLLMCDRCGYAAPPEEAFHERRTGVTPPPIVTVRCPSCGKALEPSFAYCPYCGKKV